MATGLVDWIIHLDRDLSTIYKGQVGNFGLLQGFRKIDTDKWEFANECFLRGSKHLLKNIRRRRPPQSQQVTSEASGSVLEIELENLRKEKSLLMQEVLELQRQHHGTAEHVKTVKGRLQASEQRQKQMVSFLAKVFQNPDFIERLKQMREQRLLGSPRTRKKFIKQKPHQVSHQPDTSMDAHVFKRSAESANLSSFEMLSVLPQHSLLQDLPIQTEGGPSGSGGGDQPLYKGKELAGPQPEYLIDFPEELAGEEALSGFPPPEPEIIKQEEEQVLGMEFDFWSGIDGYNFPVSTGPFISSGPSENLDKWASDESPAGGSGTSRNADDH